MRTPFLLILSTSGGAGHHRAAEALLEAAHRSGYPLRAAHYDSLDFTSKAFKRLYSESYLAMVNKIPGLWGYFYSQAEKTPYSKKGLLTVFDHFNYGRYVRSLRSLSPDLILCTHFLPFVSLSEWDLIKEGIMAPFVASTTDFDVHQLWIDKRVRRYYVHDDETAWQLSSKGVDPALVGVSGIPVGSGFSKRIEKGIARRRLDLPDNRFTVMILSGGFGIGHVQDITYGVTNLLGMLTSQSFNLIIVCGRNEVLRKDLEKKTFPRNIHASLLGYATNVHELMDASDILVSKSGGLTSAEAMAKELPMIIVDPIPGQEMRNASMITERGAGMLAHDYHNLVFKLRLCIEAPEHLAAMRERTLSLSRPRAADTIIGDIIQRFLKTS